MKDNRLSDNVADSILSMITVENTFSPGDKLPNENDLSNELGVSRTTLREAIRMLAACGVVEIKRGLGTYIKEDFSDKPSAKLSPLISARINAKDLYEMRLIFEPEAAYYAAIRATESEIQRIISLSEEIETLIAENKDRTIVEQALHRSIAKATHNEFMNRLMPIIQEAIDKGVTLSEMHKTAEIDTIADHKNIVNFIKTRNAEGARSAMKIHILHAIEQLDLS